MISEVILQLEKLREAARKALYAKKEAVFERVGTDREGKAIENVREVEQLAPKDALVLGKFDAWSQAIEVAKNELTVTKN